MSGSEFFDKMRRGEIPEPPFGRLLGMDLFDAGEGKFTMTLHPQEFHYNPMGCVHGGILATLLDSVMSAAVHTALPAGKGYMTLEIKVNFLKPVFEHTGEVLAEGEIVSLNRQVATADGRIVDADGSVYATGTATCLVFDTVLKGDSEKSMAFVLTVNARQIEGITVLDLSGRISLGEAAFTLRNSVRDLLGQEQKKILLNLEGVTYVDSAGIGELVGCRTTVANSGGELKLVNVSKRLNDLLRLARLVGIFEIHADEAAALRSFSHVA